MTAVLVRVRWIPGGTGDPAQFGLRFRTVPNVNIDDLKNMANTATVELNTHIPALYTATSGFRRCSAQSYVRVADPGSPYGFRFSPDSAEVVGAAATVAGGVAGEALPPQNAFCVTLRTQAAGRRRRGRVFTPPPPESVVNYEGAVSDALLRVAMVREICEAVEGSLGGTDIDHVIHSLVDDEMHEVIDYSATPRIDTQRRRLARE